MVDLLFLAAGRWDLPWFWAYVAPYALLVGSAFLLLDKGLLKERFRPAAGARDATLVVLGKVISLVHYVIAALDVGRFRWSGDMPPTVQGTALALCALSGAFVVWAMVVNCFFSTVVRIQTERGHHVVTAGPYRIVRHPGYAVIPVTMLASGVALGSWWSVVPMAGLVSLVIRRTALEDRFLHEHLDGCAVYAQHVRYRLIPGVW